MSEVREAKRNKLPVMKQTSHGEMYNKGNIVKS